MKEITITVTEQDLMDIREFVFLKFNISIVDDIGLIECAINQTIRDLNEFKITIEE